MRAVLVLYSSGCRADLSAVLFRASILVEVLLLHSLLPLIHLIDVSMLPVRIATLTLIHRGLLSEDPSIRDDLRRSKDRLTGGLPGLAFLGGDLGRRTSPLGGDTLVNDVELPLHGSFVVGREERRKVVERGHAAVGGVALRCGQELGSVLYRLPFVRFKARPRPIGLLAIALALEEAREVGIVDGGGRGREGVAWRHSPAHQVGSRALLDAALLDCRGAVERRAGLRKFGASLL